MSRKAAKNAEFHHRKVKLQHTNAECTDESTAFMNALKMTSDYDV
jgi:hypothetical protein